RSQCYGFARSAGNRLRHRPGHLSWSRVTCIDFLLERFAEDPQRGALLWRDRGFDYRWLLERIGYWRAEAERQLAEGPRVVILEGDYSPNALALMMALVQHGCVVVPLTEQSRARREEYAEIAQGEYLL